MSLTYTHQPPAPAWAKVQGAAELYPVARIFCVGRNYAAHAREMGRDPDREPPFFFTKSPDSLVESGTPIRYPPGTCDFQYEMELVVALGGPVFRADASAAEAAIFGHACGLDMTRRDLQLAARDAGRPWDLGKSFEESAVMGPIRPSPGKALQSGPIELRVNGVSRQAADLSELIWSVPEIIAALSQFYHLQAGDLIFTGTPAGVGPVGPGDELVGTIDGLADVRTAIRPPDG